MKVLIRSLAGLGLPEYEVTGIEESAGYLRIRASFKGAVACPHCEGKQLRIKDRRLRRLRHESWGTRCSVVELETRKWRCLSCQRSFWQRIPGIQPRVCVFVFFFWCVCLFFFVVFCC